jgi:hypothetical protein
MNEKEELTRSITEAHSLAKITNMPGWKIIEKYIDDTTDDCQEALEDEENKDMADIQASRKLLKWIKDFKDLFSYTEISAEEDQQELNRINKKGE